MIWVFSCVTFIECVGKLACFAQADEPGGLGKRNKTVYKNYNMMVCLLQALSQISLPQSTSASMLWDNLLHYRL